MDPSGITDMFDGEGMDPTMDPSGITDMFEGKDPTMDPVERTVECTIEVASGNMMCPTAKCFTPSMEEQDACDGVIELVKEIDEENDECCLKLCNYSCMSVDKMVKFEVAINGADAIRRNEDKVKESLTNAIAKTYGAAEDMITLTFGVSMPGDSVMVGVDIGPYTESDESTTMPDGSLCSGLDCVTCLDGEETNFMCTYYQGDCILAATASRDAVMSDFVWDSVNCPTDVVDEDTMDPTMDPVEITDPFEGELPETMDPTMDPVEITDPFEGESTDMPEGPGTFMPKQLVFYSDSSCSYAVTSNLALGNEMVHLLGGECMVDLSGEPVSYTCKGSGIITATFYNDFECGEVSQTITLANGVCSYIARNDYYAIMAWEGDCGGAEIDECPATECEAPVCEEIKYCSCEPGFEPVAIMDDEGCPACACTG